VELWGFILLENDMKSNLFKAKPNKTQIFPISMPTTLGKTEFPPTNFLKEGVAGTEGGGANGA
jgi:hypothetical protein